MPEACERCVLLVDDDATLRDLLSRHLEKAGFEALHAEDGIEGLTILLETLPKVIISDLQMPRMSGLEFIGVVRQRFPTIPVVVLSGAVPRELPTDVRPDCWIEKRLDAFPALVRTVDELARSAPSDIHFSQVIDIPVRAAPGAAGHMILTCTDCLRTFRAERPPGEVVGTAICTHCDARVPFLVESSAAV